MNKAPEERQPPPGPEGLEVVHREVVYRGFFRMERYRLRHALFRGGWSPLLTRELFERGTAAAVLLFDPALDRVVLVEQFRIGAIHDRRGPWLLEVVAGIVEPGETPEEVVRREAREEADCVVTDLVPICNYLVSPGGTSERITLFCGRVEAAGAGGIHGLPHEGEDIRVVAVPRTRALGWMAEGLIDNASTLIALQWLELHREELLRRWSGSDPV